MGLIRCFIGSVVLTLGACAPVDHTPPPGPAPVPERPKDLIVAFIGDQGSGPGARAVLELIKGEGSEIVLHQGDFDYRDDPEAWDDLITDVLGADFPYFASIGNHDRKRFFGPGGYQEKLLQRLERIPRARCTGDLGVLSACRYGNLFIVLSGIGTVPKRPNDPHHIAYIGEQLSQSRAPWKICSWHKNQRAMQVGKKKNEVGWKAYETCRQAGAIIATGHEHSYSRTHLMDNFESKSVLSTSSTLHIGPGRSFAFVSGLGGLNIRRQRRGGPWWAAIHSKSQGAKHGALFCIFDGGPASKRARCYFKTIDGRVVDRFTIINDGAKPY